MKQSKFEKPPKILTQKEKEQIAKDFISKAEGGDKEHQPSEVSTTPKKGQSRSMKYVHIRILETVWNDIQQVVNDTGLSMNAVCANILRKGIKDWRKELDE